MAQPADQDAAAVGATIGLIGEFRITVGGRKVAPTAWRRRDAATLVKILALAPGRQLHREQVMDALWPDLDPREAAPRLHKAAHYARQAVGRPDTLVLRGDMVSLLPGVGVRVDVAEFDAAAEDALASGDPQTAATVLDRFDDEPLPSDLYEPWAAATRERLLHRRLSLLRQAGRFERLIELDPRDEAAHLALMQQHVRAGDRGAALNQFERMDAVLRRELGIGAGPAATELRRQLLTTMRERRPLTPAEEVRLEQQIRFCRTADGITLAYAETGSGFPLVRAAHWLTHLDHDWNSPVWQHWLVDLSRHHRLVRYDERGCGMSDRDIPPPTFADWVADLETVVDAAGLEKFDLLGFSQGGAVSVAYAVRHPERVRRIVLGGAFEKGWLVDGNDSVADMHRVFADAARIGWGRNDPWFRQLFTSRFMPGGSRELWAAFNDLQRKTADPKVAVQVYDLCGTLDASADVPKVASPTLVLHGRQDQVIPFSTGRRFAARLPDSRFVPLDSDNHILLANEPAWRVFVSEVEAFLAD